MGHARAIINVENVDAQLAIYNKIIKDDLSVRKVEAMVRDLMAGNEKEEPYTKEKKRADDNYEIKQLQQKLSSHFGTKINIKSDDNNKGEIKIPFVSAEDLNRILEILNL
jgi:ParB family chromosome partitioning protein